jgi:protein-L-isoaspartate(D-aspartate) O-methyltransferase
MEFEKEHEQLIQFLKLSRRITSKKVENAFREIPRENFIPEQLRDSAYSDTPLQIGHSQTISAPHMVAIMIEHLDLKKNHKVLEIGAGSGYHAAIASKIIGEKGHIYTVERIEELAKTAAENLRKTGIKNVTVIKDDGSIGLQKNAPYDRIYVTCAAPKIPEQLIDQLKDPGKLLIPVGNRICDLILLEKKEGKINKNSICSCAFVPLIGKKGF